jgi:hypothetical protein
MITLDRSPSLRNALTQARDLPGPLKAGSAQVATSWHVRHALGGSTRRQVRAGGGVADVHSGQPGHAERGAPWCGPPRPAPGQRGPPLVVGAAGCAPQQAAADQLGQPGLGVAETGGWPTPWVTEVRLTGDDGAIVLASRRAESMHGLDDDPSICLDGRRTPRQRRGPGQHPGCRLAGRHPAAEPLGRRSPCNGTLVPGARPGGTVG